MSMWTITMFEFVYVDDYNVRVCLCGRLQCSSLSMWTIIMFEFVYVDDYNVRVCLCGRL